jgi:uncharacterized protein
MNAPVPEGDVTIVTQTSVQPDADGAFQAWQQETSRVVAGFPGFLRQTVLPPSPPAQEDWVILQHFDSAVNAVRWLNAPERQQRLTDVQKLLTGRTDVHLVAGSGTVPAASPVSAVISTRVKPGKELAYRRWEQRVAVAQSAAPGLQGYRFEPPIQGVQDDWLAILRFDTEANLQAWLNSPVRQKLLEEAHDLTEEFHARIARTGFDQWFAVAGATAEAPAVWKQNLLVLLMLYPVVFLFGHFVQTPLLSARLGLNFATALFIGNVASVILLNWLVPWTTGRFLWWLNPKPGQEWRLTLLGSGVIGVLLAVMILLFSAL